MLRYALRPPARHRADAAGDHHRGILRHAARAGRPVRRGAGHSTGDQGEPECRLRARPADDRAVWPLPRRPGARRPGAVVQVQGLSRRGTDRARPAGDADRRRARAAAGRGARRAPWAGGGAASRRPGGPRGHGHGPGRHRHAEFRAGAGPRAGFRHPPRLAAGGGLGTRQRARTWSCRSSRWRCPSSPTSRA